MNERKSVELSRGFLLAIFGGMVWGSIGAAVFQLLDGSYGLGSLFLVAGLAFLLVAAEGSLIRRLAKSRISLTNLYTAMAVFGLVGANEVWGLLGVRGSPDRFLLEMVDGVVFVLLVVVTEYQGILIVRRGRQA